MVTKDNCIEIFNSMIRGTPVSFQEKLLPMYSEYLTENNIENSNEMINLVVQNPGLMQQVIPELVNYYSRKFEIKNIFFKNQTILYYE
jgi:hypothetical protein